MNHLKKMLKPSHKINICSILLIFALVTLALSIFTACSDEKVAQSQKNTPPDMAALRGEYFDFAIKYRLDYVPCFEADNAPSDSNEYLFWAFAINLDNWGEDKGTMTREYVETSIHNHFDVKEIAHKSMWKGWNYDGEKYVAVPTSISDKPLYALQDYAEDVINGRNVYTITLAQCTFPEYPPSEEDMANYRADIVAGNLSNFTVNSTETFKFYLNKETGEPVFIMHTQNQSET